MSIFAFLSASDSARAPRVAAAIKHPATSARAKTVVVLICSPPSRLWLLDVRLFPVTDPEWGLVEQPLVVPHAKLLARLRGQLREEWLVHVVDLQVLGLIGRGDLVGAEQEAIGMAVDQVRS